jgi:glycosyltransferase involved in cell wall biosynthesis
VPLIGPNIKRLVHTYYHHKHENFDLIHAQIAWPTAGFVGEKLKRWCRLPFVITPHGGDVQVAPEIGYGTCLDPKVEAKVRFTLQAADRITAVSQRMRAAIAGYGVTPERIRDVPCGCEFEKIQRVPRGSLRQKLGLSADDFVVLTVGRNAPVKDIPTLIEALRLAAASDRRVKCIVAGPDEPVRQLFEKAQLSDRTRLLGRIPQGYDPKNPDESVFQTPYPELIAAYHACDVFVSTSYLESFNTAALDAFACGKPVIVTNTQGFLDVLEEGVNGYSVPPRSPAILAEKLLHLAGHRDRCRAMGEAGRKIAANYDWARVARLYLEVYEETVKIPFAAASR